MIGSGECAWVKRFMADLLYRVSGKRNYPRLPLPSDFLPGWVPPFICPPRSAVSVWITPFLQLPSMYRYCIRCGLIPRTEVSHVLTFLLRGGFSHHDLISSRYVYQRDGYYESQSAITRDISFGFGIGYSYPFKPLKKD